VSSITEVFSTFEAALAASGAGYNAHDIADVIAYKTSLPFDPRQIAPEQALNSLIAVGMSAAEIANRPLRVLDFGGGCGFHYFRVRSAVRFALDWALVETPTMAERAAKVANGAFGVYSAVEQATQAHGKEMHLIHASSAIQYVPDPLETLKSLADLNAPFFALLRFPMWNVQSTICLQRSRLAGNGIGPMPPNIADREIAYPVTFVNFDEVLRIFSQYEIALSMLSPSSNYEFRGQLVRGVSLILRRKGA
jgi:putative methyltransferase (TIGR04325 family)